MRAARRSIEALLALLGPAVLSAACAGPGARAPSGPRPALPSAFVQAFRDDAVGDPNDAVKAYLDVVRVAAQAGTDPWQVAALQAALDALADRSMPSLDDAADDAALTYRTNQGPAIAAELARVAGDAKGAFARGLIERALASMAEHDGDAAGAARHRAAAGCLRDALVVGPVAWAAVTGVNDVGPLDQPEARIEGAYPSATAFDTPVHPIAVRSQGCAIDLSAESTRAGVRAVIADVTVPRTQSIGLVLRAHGAATLRAGGTVVLQRPFELGDGQAARFVRVVASPGTLRLVARVGTAKEDDVVEIDAFDETGAPLAAETPRVGSRSPGRVLRVEPALPPPASNEDEAVLSAAASLAAGDPHDAEQALWATATRATVRPDLAMLYGRAVEKTRDLSATTRAERARSAYEHVLEAWPESWEARIAHAVLAGVRRGRDEAGIEELSDLDTLAAKSKVAVPAFVDAFEAMVAGREELFDRADAALSRARNALGKTAFFSDAEDAARRRVGAERAASACAQGRPKAHDTLDCLDALHQMGDHAGQARELARLRDLLGAPNAFLAVELREALAARDTVTARRAFGAMLPGHRTMSALAMLAGPGDLGPLLLQMAPTADDAPAAIAPLLRVAGEQAAHDETGALDELAEKLAAQDRAKSTLPNAGTAVLLHTERYDVSADGLVHWLLFDVRRVNGTTDVEDNAQAAAPDIWGRATMRALRRRILKKDGRIIEPDHTPRASQAHADLSQLEQGDAVEAVYEGYALPGDTGDIGVDTPDLLPARTAVHEATIELRVPRALHGSLWSHTALGHAAEHVEGESRVMTWHIVDKPARREEDGVPKMDRNVGVSFSTARWAGISRALHETVAALDEHDPEIAAWAHDATADAGTSPRAIVDALVTASGKALREADADTLSDLGGGIEPVQSQTARTFLASHAGSRTWLVLRSLRELGIACDLVVAENEPYSADPSFPPHFGRFVHPLLVAHVPAGSGAKADAQDVWVDADVSGPPLPAGRISPELRGRLALGPDGSIAPLPVVGSRQDERDEIDVRLALDSQGTAHGTFAVLLRGRDAQQLAEALFRIVGADRQRALRDVVLAWLPWANVDDVELASTEGSWQVSLRAAVSVNGYAQAEGDKTWLLPGLDALHWAWPRARVSSLSATFASRAGRESALAVSSAVQYHVHRRVDLPPDTVVSRVPGPLDVKSKLLEASRAMTVADGVVEDDFVLGVATGTVSASDYESFVQAAHAADDGFLASTRLRPAPTASGPVDAYPAERHSP